MIYKNTCSFQVEKSDDDGFMTGKYMTIRKGQKWEVDESGFRMVGDNDTIRLINIKNNSWLEIDKDFLDLNFEQIKEQTDD